MLATDVIDAWNNQVLHRGRERHDTKREPPSVGHLDSVRLFLFQQRSLPASAVARLSDPQHYRDQRPWNCTLDLPRYLN